MQSTADADWERLAPEVRRAREARALATADRRSFVDELAALLFDADPIGINFGRNTDEYLAEAETIAAAIDSTESRDDVLSLTHEVFVNWFDPSTAGPLERYAQIADAIWALECRRRGVAG